LWTLQVFLWDTGSSLGELKPHDKKRVLLRVWYFDAVSLSESSVAAL
jgi:hypothetical protein